MGVSWASWGPPGSLLGVSWAPPGPPGASWGPPGASWELSGGSWEPPVASDGLLKPLGDLLGASWSLLGPPGAAWGLPGASWGPPRASWEPRGASWGPPGRLQREAKIQKSASPPARLQSRHDPLPGPLPFSSLREAFLRQRPAPEGASRQPS